MPHVIDIFATNRYRSQNLLNCSESDQKARLKLMVSVTVCDRNHLEVVTSSPNMS